MKELTAGVALNAGTLMLLVSVVGLVLSMSVSQVVGPVLVGGITAGAVLMGWGAFTVFTAQEEPGAGVDQALERIRRVRHG